MCECVPDHVCICRAETHTVVGVKGLKISEHVLPGINNIRKGETRRRPRKSLCELNGHSAAVADRSVSGKICRTRYVAPRFSGCTSYTIIRTRQRACVCVSMNTVPLCSVAAFERGQLCRCACSVVVCIIRRPPSSPPPPPRNCPKTAAAWPGWNLLGPPPALYA